VLAWIVPPYARAIGIAPSFIGLLILANAVTVVLAQLPIVRAAEGRSRVGALSLAAAIWVLACLLATAFIPLIADLAPPALRGRYMAAAGLSWWLGLAVAPMLGGPLLAVSPAPADARRRRAGGVGDRVPAGLRARATYRSARDTSSHTARCRLTFASRSVWTATILVRSAARARASAARKPSTSAATS
jgi:hypothetical protein